MPRHNPGTTKLMPTKPGTILWASVADPNNHVKDRPLVVLSVGPGNVQEIVCACITSREKKPKPSTHLRLGWSSDGRSMTGLTKKSWAVANWIVMIHQSDVRRESGQLTEKVFEEFMELVAKHRS